MSLRWQVMSAGRDVTSIQSGLTKERRRPVSKANRKATPRRRTPATPPYSFTAAVSEALATHPDAAIFAAVAEHNTAWTAAIKLYKQARTAAYFDDMPRGHQEAGRRALAAETRLLSLVPTTPEGAAAFLRAVYEKMEEELPTPYKLMGAAIKHAVDFGL